MQEKPGDKSFRSWRKILAHTFLIPQNGNITKSTRARNLQQPLGKWSSTSQWFQKKWKSYYAPDAKAIYILDEETGNYQRHKHNRNTRQCNHTTQKRGMLFSKTAMIRNLPRKVIPINYNRQKEHIRVPGYATIQQYKPINAT